MESQQTVMIPNDTLFSSDGRNFMVSLPVETADGAGVINVPIIFTTDASSTTELENQPVSTSVGADIASGETTGGFVLKNINGDPKNGFYLDASQFALLSGGAEHLILTTTGNTDEGEEGSATETDPREQLLFTQTTDATDCESDGAAQTTYITSVLMPSEQNDEDLTMPDAPPLEGVLTSVADIRNNDKFQSPLTKPEVQSRKPGRPRKVVDDVQPPISKGPFRCELCNQEFLSWIQFRRHKAEHREDKPNRCPHCPRSFNLQSNLALHLCTHAKGPPWQCPECFRSFSRLASLKAHTMIHELEENLFCEQCGEECISQVQLDRHATQEHPAADSQVVHSCRHCSRDFPNKLQLKAHLMEHSKRAASLRLTQHRKPHRSRRTAHTHACKVCELAFNKPSQLIRHLRIHTGEKPYGCDECGYRFTQKGSLQMHMLKHRGCRPYCCNFCPATFTQRGNLRSHIARVHIMPHPGQQVYQCQQCTCVFRKVGSLNAHVSRLHSRSAPQMKQNMNATRSSIQLKGILETSQVIQSQVSIDGNNILVSGDNSDILQQAIHKSGLQQPGAREENHITEVVLADSQGDGTTRRFIVRMRKQAGMRWHQCIYCTKEFKKPSDLIRHMRTHTNEKPYSCEICHRSFAVKSTLNAHMHTHTQERAYICNVCEKRYASASSLGVHMRLHLGIKPFACETCGRRFRTTGNRAAHQCESARRERAAKRRLQIAERREMREQIREGSFPFLQDPLFVSESGITVVSKKKGALPDESEIGQMIRPFVCVECGCRFKKSSHLKQHEISHKGVKSFSCNVCNKNFVSAGVIKAHMRTHEKTRKFKCDDCGQLYSTKGSLKRHLASHSSRKPYVCPYCHRDFKTSSNCRKHIRVHAKEVLSGIMEPNTESTSDVMRQMEQELPALNSSQTATEMPAITNVQLSQKSTSHSPKLKEDLKQTSVIISGSVLKKTGNMSDSGLGLLTPENIPSLEENINQQMLSTSSQLPCSSHVMDLQHPSQPTSSMGDIVIPSSTHTNTMPISLQDQSILTLGQSTSSDLKATVDFPPLLTEQAGVLGSGPGSGLVTVESVYIQGFDGQALDTTLFSGGIPIQTDPIEMGVLSNILASASSHADPNTEDEPSRFSCERCKEGFVSIESLRQHASEEHTLACVVCQERFESQALLEHHLASHSKEKTATRKNECQMCKLAFRTPKQLAIHKSRAHRTNRRNPTPLAPATEGPLPPLTTTAEHLQSRRKGSKATQVSEEEVTKALQLGLQEPSLSEQVFLASVQERERLSSIKETTEYNAQMAPKYANACTMCPKSFKKPSDMVRHMRTHTGERPFVCSQCGKGFTVKSTLVAHFATHRKDASSGIPCHLCGSTFATKGSLRVHMRIHTGVKPLKCPHCDMSFRTSGHRKAHILSAHRIQTESNKREMESNLESEVETDVETSAIDQPMQEEEDVAPEPEASSENLQLLPIQLETTELIQLDENLLQQLQAGNFILHSADSEGTIRFEVFSEVTGQQVIGEISTDTVVDKSNDATSEEVIVNSKQCATCGKSFAKPSQLLRHIRIHTGDKPFPCMICAKRFNQKNALNTHLLMHTGHKPHQCSYCSKVFSQAGNLRTHVRRAHPGIHQLTMKSKQ